MGKFKLNVLDSTLLDIQAEIKEAENSHQLDVAVNEKAFHYQSVSDSIDAFNATIDVAKYTQQPPPDPMPFMELLRDIQVGFMELFFKDGKFHGIPKGIWFKPWKWGRIFRIVAFVIRISKRIIALIKSY